MIQTHNIDVPILDKESCDEFSKFQAEQQLSGNRKLSIEYFKEESNKIGKKMGVRGGNYKKFKGFNKQLSLKTNKYNSKEDFEINQYKEQELLVENWLTFK